jgi:phenylalanyl-tRNA synthetase beta chain
MKVPYTWLKELVDIDVSPEQLAADLASIGLEVESIEKRGIPDNVVAAKITAVAPHPNADRLTLCLVDYGSQNPEKIVCGAPNVASGIHVALALPGAVLAREMVVTKAKIRGVDSAGMLCSERELGISDDHSGIMALPDTAVVGTPLKEMYPDEAILDIDLTPNRGDCCSIIGIAREIAAKYGKKLNPVGLRPQESDGSIADYIEVIIKNAEACPRYMGRLVQNVTIKESPQWLKERILACGLRPINNVVDITNYILLLFGQPMHAFDYATIEGKKIIVKNAADGQKFVTLDDVERTLCAEDLLICDAGRAVALAGVMGGANTEISPQTTDVFLECAYFNPVGVRKTSKRLDLSSDSSYRFERGVDPEGGLEGAIDTAAELIRTLAGGSIVKGAINAYPKPLAPRRAKLRPAQVTRLLGCEIEKHAIVAILESLQIRCVGESSGAIECEVPLFRHDLAIEADLIEEVGRYYGYDNIPVAETAPVSMIQALNPQRVTIDTIRKALAYGGFHEALTNSMTSEKRRKLLTPEAEPVKLLNPLSPDMAQLRTTLLGNLLEIVSYNLNRKNTNNRFFEIGKTFVSKGLETLPDERDVVALLIEGDYEPAAWMQKPRQANFYILKAALDSLARHCQASSVDYSGLKAGKACFGAESAELSWDNGVKGICGRISDDICRAFDIDSSIYYAELDIAALISAEASEPSYSPLPRHPAVERDFCFVMPESLHSSVISNEMRAISPLVESAEPFDVYRGGKLGEGLKSIAYAVRLRDAGRTLTDAEAEKVCSAIIETMKSKHGAVLRS